MDNIHSFPQRKAIEEEAGAWLIRLEGDTPPGDEERAALMEWLNRSPLHREELADLARHWGNLNILTELAVPLGKPEPQPAAPVTGWALWPQAAMASVMLCCLVLLYYFNPAFGRDDTATNGSYATAVGEQTTLTLADGSILLINTDSQLEINFSENFRDIYLRRGEAHFEVAKNPDKPFRVYAGQGRVRAVGTAFTVYLKPQGVDVTVTEGKVALAGSEAARPEQPASDLGLLTAGQMATIKPLAENTAATLSPVVTLASDTIQQRLSWHNGLLIFEGERLAAVIAEINRYTDITIELADQSLADIAVGGQLKIGNTDTMFASLEGSFGLRIERVSASKVKIYARP